MEEDEEEVEQWGVRRLTISRADLNLLRHCNKLEKLQLLQLDHLLAPEVVPSLALLSNCTELKDLEITPTSDAEQMQGFADALMMLTSLQKLSSSHFLHAEQAELMNTSRIQQPLLEVVQEAGEEVELPAEELSTEFALPSLKELRIVTVGNTTPPQRSRFVSRLMQQRPGLEVLFLPQQCIVSMMTLVSNEWSCLNLTELTISLTGPGSNEVEGQEAWFSFYQQLGRLRELVTLHIYCSQVQKSPDDGIMLLQGAVSLNRLTIEDQQGVWTHQEVVTLMVAAPSLTYLNLEPLTDEGYQHMAVWLEQLGNGHILAAHV
ncbi:hypothetical protein BGX23_002083 [Mortierella sp. AD031]|nr:hypothetical protein BGX23_002083 [Mortierella sp. AD031]